MLNGYLGFCRPAEMGQGISRLCGGASGSDPGTIPSRRAEGPTDPSDNHAPDSRSTPTGQLQTSPAVSSVSMLANFDEEDDGERDLESPWQTVSLEEGSVKRGMVARSDVGRDVTALQSGKRQGRARKRAAAAGTSEDASAPAPNGRGRQLRPGPLGAIPGDEAADYRPGNLPPPLGDATPMREASRLLGVLSEHAQKADDLQDAEKGPESGDSVRRLIRHDIGRERSVNARLRELKDIEGRKSERRLSVTATVPASLHVIPELASTDEPADPEEFQYSETNLYF